MREVLEFFRHIAFVGCFAFAADYFFNGRYTLLIAAVLYLLLLLEASIDEVRIVRKLGGSNGILYASFTRLWYDITWPFIPIYHLIFILFYAAGYSALILFVL